jgi:acyl carrier protein
LASVYERVRRIVSERLGVDEDKATIDARLTSDLDADSLELVEVVMAVEREFDLRISDDEADDLCTVGDIVALVDRLMSPEERPRPSWAF